VFYSVTDDYTHIMHRLYCFQKFAKLTTVSKNSVKESGLVLLGKISWKII